MTFAQRRNRLTTHFSERIPVVKRRVSVLSRKVNPLNAELNPICRLLALLGAHHILRVSRVKVKSQFQTKSAGPIR